MFEGSAELSSDSRDFGVPELFFGTRTLSFEEVFQKRRQLRRELLKSPQLQEVRIAVLGGATTNEVVDLLEVLLLSEGFRPLFYQSEYNKYYEDAVLYSPKLQAFQPDLVYI